jgi:hypothetical protein
VLNPAGESTSANYAQVDDTTKRLWRTQIGKANPWGNRGQNPEEDDEQEAPAADAPAASTAKAPARRRNMISQTDKLFLQREEEEPANPFESLLKHRLKA